jgi:hypothetical protein
MFIKNRRFWLQAKFMRPSNQMRAMMMVGSQGNSLYANYIAYTTSAQLVKMDT